jgi:hypothetical protein
LKIFSKILPENGKKIAKEKALFNIVATIGACKFSTIEHFEKFLSVFGGHLVSIICLLERGGILYLLLKSGRDVMLMSRLKNPPPHCNLHTLMINFALRFKMGKV